MADFKTMEEIRTSAGMSQAQFAARIGTSRRTYTDRLNGGQPNWSIQELTEAATMNDGKIKIEYKGKTYKLTIQEEEAAKI